MTVELAMEVARARNGRLSGTLRLEHETAPHRFSGTLELMRVLEDLVPAGEDEIPSDRAVRS